jgi:ATP-dependent DNA helicase RecG
MTLFGVDPVGDAVATTLNALAEGTPVGERRVIDLKEEAGRRGKDGAVTPGQERNEDAVVALAGEVACMANTPGGGALILGVADDGTLIGTELSVDWLQVRLFQLLRQACTTVVVEAWIHGVRLLVIRCPPAIEPIRWRGRITWRVGDQCQEIDAGTWRDRRSQSQGYDWSAQDSGVPLSHVRLEAVLVARAFLRDRGDENSLDLSEAEPSELVRRLALVHDSDQLTNAGALLFVGRSTPGLDYMRRPAPGADSEERINRSGLSLLEEIADVFRAARSYNPESAIELGLVVTRPRMIPERALREAIVNGLAHREWTDPAPTTVEHLGNTLRVTSPGGFYGGVRTENIINHPPVSRNRELSSALATLCIAERQGIGVDRMFGDMIRLGYPEPAIRELDGTCVLTVLVGERRDVTWTQWLSDVDPDPRQNLRVLMGLHRLVTQRWTDPDDLVPLLQVSRDEAAETLMRIAGSTSPGGAVAHHVAGVPDGVQRPVLAIDRKVVARLDPGFTARGLGASALSREDIAHSYARAHGRISTTELGSVLQAAPTNVGQVLKSLESKGALEPSRASRRGAGFFYRWVGDE